MILHTKYDTLDGVFFAYNQQGYKFLEGNFKSNRAVGVWKIFDSMGRIATSFDMDTVPVKGLENFSWEYQWLRIHYESPVTGEFPGIHHSHNYLHYLLDDRYILTCIVDMKARVTQTQYRNYWDGNGIGWIWDTLGRLVSKQICIHPIAYEVAEDHGYTDAWTWWQRSSFSYNGKEFTDITAQSYYNDFFNDGTLRITTEYTSDSTIICRYWRKSAVTKGSQLVMERRLLMMNERLCRPPPLAYADRYGNVLPCITIKKIVVHGLQRVWNDDGSLQKRMDSRSRQ